MEDKRRESIKTQNSLQSYTESRDGRRNQHSYDEYLIAMRRVQRYSHSAQEVQSPRQRHRKELPKTDIPELEGNTTDTRQARRISTIASLIPDEIIYKPSDYSIQKYDSALMFIDVSGFTEVCEKYTKTGRGGSSRLTHVLNSYIGAMIQEILAHHGDVMKFGGDAFICMWKPTSTLTIQDAVHTAIDCGLIIQKNYGRHVTDVGVVLKVKIAISAGLLSFSIIGDENAGHQHYVMVGRPVWDVKTAEFMTSAGDVVTNNKAWAYVNEQEYCTQPCGDSRHTKVLGLGVMWRGVEGIVNAKNDAVLKELPAFSKPSIFVRNVIDDVKTSMDLETPEIREFSLRPAVIYALRSSSWQALRTFMLMPVLRAVDNDEPMDYLTEVRNVVIVFINVITRTVTDSVLIGIVNNAYKLVCSISSESGGLVNKVSMFDKDMIMLVIFGLRGLKHKDEAQIALLCASNIKNTLMDPDILSISIGITSGTTYCGVVGHVLRREYTVIGSAVNKAARLMIAYPDKITCDKQTFVSSKLGLDFFRLMEAKSLKGFEKPGPIYEFNENGWIDGTVIWRHPVLDRNNELLQYKTILQEAINQHHERFTRYRDHKFAVAIIGSEMIGKRRLMGEFINMTPIPMRLDKIVLTEGDTVPFGLVRQVIYKVGMTRSSHVNNNLNLTTQDTVETIIRFGIGTMPVTSVQTHALNVIFDCRFPLPDGFVYTGDILRNHNVKAMLHVIFKKMFPSLRVLPVSAGSFIDDHSWLVLLIMLETKHVFIILTITNENLSETATACLDNNMIVKMYLSGVNRLYHAALACQFLDVQAIPADLEKVIQCASNGMPGWIQNLIISMIQRNELTVETVPRSEALDARAVMPSIALLQRADSNVAPTPSGRNIASNVYTATETDTIQMAVLRDSYNYEDLELEMTLEVMTLKTYDSLHPFEKMVLKCGSVLGDVFSSRMLLHVIQSDSVRKVYKAIAKLFEIRVLECEGGDFTRDTSLVLVHPAPAAIATAQPPYCACIGTRQSPDCRDLPMYAFCGYIKFRHGLFRQTTYELLTEAQKKEMHSRALMYLERYTRRCISCGAGCFSRLFGVTCDDGLVEENKALKRIREQIAALSAETRMTSASSHVDEEYAGNPDAEETNRSQKKKMDQTPTRVRSFSSLDLDSCECMPILITVYSQVIGHVRGVGDCSKIIETYLEYADLSVLNLNLAQAFKLLTEVEEFLQGKVSCQKSQCNIKWMMDARLARILTVRARCLLASGDYNEAKKQLLRAMKLYCDPFPTNRLSVQLRIAKCSFQQTMALYVAPRFYVATEKGVSGMFYELICRTLNQLYKLFTICNERENAALAAKWSLNYALKSHITFRNLCVTLGNMVAVYTQQQKFSKCEKLESLAIDISHRKRGPLDVTEVYAACLLYTNLFRFYAEYGKRKESLEFGMSVLPMITRFSDGTVYQTLVLWTLKLLISDQRIQQMIMIMREFLYKTNNYDLSSETWYYYYAVVIMLDTGYCVESYGDCERFYTKKGDAILDTKTPEAAWNFFVCMWLVTIRTGAWERTILWEDKIKEVMAKRLQRQEYNIMLIIRLVEGTLILMAREIENRNVQKKIQMEKVALLLFKEISVAIRHAPMYRSRYSLFYAYYCYMKGKISKAYQYLAKAAEQAKEQRIRTVEIWVKHTDKHWKGKLSRKFVHYWSEHTEEDKLLDYRDFDAQNTQIVPFTLPLPQDAYMS